MTREEATGFIGTNASFYLEKWKLHSGSAFKGWNWAATLFGIEWMAYRKMYVEAVLYFVFVIFITSLTVFVLGIYSEFLGHCFRILIGMLGNALYRKKALRILHKMDEQDEAQRLDRLSRQGGVSRLSVVIVLLLELVYVVLVWA